MEHEKFDCVLNCSPHKEKTIHQIMKITSHLGDIVFQTLENLSPDFLSVFLSLGITVPKLTLMSFDALRVFFPFFFFFVCKPEL